MGKPGDWFENTQHEADIAHTLGGVFVLHTTVMFSRNWWPVLIIEALLVVYVLVKEFWWDIKNETGETMASGARDALGWLIGTAIGWALLGGAYTLGTWRFLSR